jgi:hypothetical protein
MALGTFIYHIEAFMILRSFEVQALGEDHVALDLFRALGEQGGQLVVAHDAACALHVPEQYFEPEYAFDDDALLGLRELADEYEVEPVRPPVELLPEAVVECGLDQFVPVTEEGRAADLQVGYVAH